MSRTLDFLLDICKSIRINGLNIKYHKILQRFKKNLLEHITMFNIEQVYEIVKLLESALLILAAIL